MKNLRTVVLAFFSLLREKSSIWQQYFFFSLLRNLGYFVPGEYILKDSPVTYKQVCVWSRISQGSVNTGKAQHSNPPSILAFQAMSGPWGRWWSDTTKDFAFTFHFHALEKEMTTHSSVLAWRIPETEKPGRLPSLGSHSQTWLKRLSSSSSSKPKVKKTHVPQWSSQHYL